MRRNAPQSSVRLDGPDKCQLTIFGTAMGESAMNKYNLSHHDQISTAMSGDVRLSIMFSCGKCFALAFFILFSLALYFPSPVSASSFIKGQVSSGLIRCPPAEAVRTVQLPQVKIHPRAAAGLTRTYGGTPISVTTFHYDNGRTGWNSSETDLTPASVASSNFGLLQDIPILGFRHGAATDRAWLHYAGRFSA